MLQTPHTWRPLFEQYSISIAVIAAATATLSAASSRVLGAQLCHDVVEHMIKEPQISSNTANEILSFVNGGISSGWLAYGFEFSDEVRVFRPFEIKCTC
jgi:hypothetical protein